ncbi:hypothetical protein Gotur_017766, partial [Gossypium turneri]
MLWKHGGDKNGMYIMLSHIEQRSCFHTLSKVTIIGRNKLRDMTWLVLAPNLKTLSIIACAKMEEILSEGKLGEVAGVIGIPYLKPFL